MKLKTIPLLACIITTNVGCMKERNTNAAAAVYVEYYIMQKSIAEELFNTISIDEISSRNTDLTKISETHGVAKIPCEISFKDLRKDAESFNYTVNITLTNDSLVLYYRRHQAEYRDTFTGLNNCEMKFAIYPSTDKYILNEEWGEMEYVAIARLFKNPGVGGVQRQLGSSAAPVDKPSLPTEPEGENHAAGE